MREHRMSKGETEYYTSFEELAKGWNCHPVYKQTKDKAKLRSQQEVFMKRHLCPACKSLMKWIEGTSVCTCTNPNCKGIRHEIETDDGEKKVWYTTVYHLLDNKATEIAINLFS